MSGRIRVCCTGIAAFCAVLAAAGCGNAPDGETAKRIHAMLLEERWSEALPLAKRYVNAHPEDPSGHLLLGQAYLYASPPYHTVAVGEFQVALGLERATHDVGELRGLMDQDTFLLTAYEETAYAHVEWITLARGLDVPVSFVVPRLHDAMGAVVQALAIDENDATLLRLKERIAYYLDRYYNPERRERPRGVDSAA